MSDSQALKATLFAFRKREGGGVLLGASLAFVILSFALTIGFFALTATQWSPLLDWYASFLNAAMTDPAQAQAIAPPTGLGMLMLIMLAWMFLFFLLLASFEAASLRRMLRGEKPGGLFGLNLGRDTWRVYSVYWIWALLYIAFTIIMAILLGLVLVGLTLTPAFRNGDIAPITALPVFYIFEYGLMAYFAVRFAPAAATSVARGKFAFFSAWTVTKGRFWALFGAFLLWFLYYLVMMVAFYTALFALLLSPMLSDLGGVGANPQAMVQFEMDALQRYMQAFMQPQTAVALVALHVVFMAAATIFYLGLFGVNARAAQAALDDGKIQRAA